MCLEKKSQNLQKKVNFLKRDPFEKNPKRFFFLYPWGVLRLFYLINFLIGACLEHPGPGFVFGENSANFSKIKIKFFGKTPCVKIPKRFSFWYPQTSLILCYFIGFFLGACFKHPGPGFVFWENSAKFSKIKNHFLELRSWLQQQDTKSRASKC